MPTSPSPTENPSSGLSRRTFAKAAAWSVPVVGLAVATPAHATSLDSQLLVSEVFIWKAGYLAGGGQGSVDSVHVTVLGSTGQPWPGQPVTLTFPGSPPGLSFSGSPSWSGVTGPSGSVSVPVSITAETPNGGHTLQAQSGPLTVPGTVNVTSGPFLMGMAGGTIYSPKVGQVATAAVLIFDSNIWRFGTPSTLRIRVVREDDPSVPLPDISFPGGDTRVTNDSGPDIGMAVFEILPGPGAVGIPALWKFELVSVLGAPADWDPAGVNGSQMMHGPFTVSW